MGVVVPLEESKKKAVASIEPLVGLTHADDHHNVQVSFADLKLQTLPLYEDGVRELVKQGIVTKQRDAFGVQPGRIYRLYTYQSILKNFDHTTVNLD